MKQELSYIENETILLRKFIGQVKFIETLQSWEDIITNSRIKPSVRGVLNDFTDAELQMEIEDLEKLIAFFNENIEVFKDLKLAVVAVNPREIVIPIYAETKYPEFKIHAFSTLKAATNWIKMGS